MVEFKDLGNFMKVLVATHILEMKNEDTSYSKISEVIRKLDPEISDDEIKNGFKSAYDWGLIYITCVGENKCYYHLSPESRGTTSNMLKLLGYLEYEERPNLPVEL
jgi:hypothetical protein